MSIKITALVINPVTLLLITFTVVLFICISWMAGLEMTSCSPASSLTQAAKLEQVTLWDLFERAAKAQYGDNIQVIKTPWTQTKLDNLNFELSVVSKDREPKETRRTIVDINMKEYKNSGQKEVDETIVQVHKSTSKSQGNRYSFSATKGVSLGIESNIGAQVMGVAMVGGSLGVNLKYGKEKSTTTESEETQATTLSFTYSQEEKISVSPGTKVKATITTYSVKYEQQYAVKFAIDSSVNIPVTYKTRCQQTCFGRSTGLVNVKQLLKSLPNFCIEDGKATFTQTGTLSWVGEGCSVDKLEEPLTQI